MAAGGMFSSEEMANMSSGLCPPAPKDYVLPSYFPSLKEAKRIVIDLETRDPKLKTHGNGVYRKDGYICGVALGAWNRAGEQIVAEYYPTRHRSGPNLDEDKVFDYLKDNLNYFEGELCGANILYDGDWLQTKGVRPRYAKWRDVQWAEALLDETALSYKLETLGQHYLGYGKTTNHFATMYGKDYIYRFNEVHPGHARIYGLGDITLPNKILDLQLKELDRLKMTGLFELESRLMPILLYMREHGVRIDMQRALRLRGMLEEKLNLALANVGLLSGVQFTVENMHTDVLLEHAFRLMNIKPPRSEKGKISVKTKWLKQDCGEFGKALAAAYRYEKAKSTFVDGYVFDYAVDGRLHGDFHPLRKCEGEDDDDEAGTESGRFSSTNPNLQNIPARDEEIGPECRGMFIPEEGGQWWSMDGSQIEYRWLVHFAVEGIIEKGKRRMCTGADLAQQMYIQDPKTDFHTLVATLTGLKRKDAKNLNFGLVYGMGLAKLCRTLHENGIPGMMDADGKPTEELKAIWETYHSKAPFVKELLGYWANVASATGEVRTFLGRRSQFEMYEPLWKKMEDRRPALPIEKAVEAYGLAVRRGETHKGLNRKIQGSAADWMKLGMVQAWEAGVFTSTSDFTLALTVHDELDGTIFPTARGQECYRELKHILETSMTLHVPVLVGDGVGATWAEAK